MKAGLDLVALATEVDRQNKSKFDMAVPVPRMEMFADGIATGLSVEGMGEFGINDIAHDHIAGYTGIDRRYYNRMKDVAPQLLTDNVNHWFSKSEESRMVRTLDGNARAMLSPRYRTLDNYPVVSVIYEEATKFSQELVLASSQVTERKLYMKFVMPGMTAVVPSKVGDVVRAGVIVSNSEVGFGRLSIQRFLETLRCTNGMVMSDGSFKRAHIGKAMEELDEAYEIFQDETRAADDRAFFMKVRDVFHSALTNETFMKDVQVLTDATTKEIKGHVVGAVQVLSTQYTFNETERDSVLQHLIRGGDLSKYGLANAVTRTAEDLPSYDRATEFEKIGGEIIVMPENQWFPIANALEADGQPKKRGRKPKNAVIDVVAH